MWEIVVATRNRGKIAEIAAILEPTVRVLSLDDVGFAGDLEEAGSSFEENAVSKARVVADATRLLTVADDSGLLVDALGGRPGVLSARYGGDNLTDADRVALLLEELKGVPRAQRTAEFVCVIAVATPSRVRAVWSGRVYGVIACEPRGSHGFGYDPVFEYLPVRKTFAEMEPEEKNAVSHRGRAVRQLPRRLKELAEDG
ncbi:MAG: XTP/dITP diphosphatase [Armatimonadetes bacterium]|nr:XTP/dITP diphosphatase [Armatimonadota bacterium]